MSHFICKPVIAPKWDLDNFSVPHISRCPGQQFSSVVPPISENPELLSSVLKPSSERPTNPRLALPKLKIPAVTRCLHLPLSLPVRSSSQLSVKSSNVSSARKSTYKARPNDPNSNKLS
ncbi:unnamed protein product [Diplocarpon coronariae]